jgi:hypothetical protein
MAVAPQAVDAVAWENARLASEAGIFAPFPRQAVPAESRAVHLAGHIVAGLFCGRTLQAAALDTPASQIWCPNPAAASSDESAHIALAGPIAEQQRFGAAFAFLDDIQTARRALAAEPSRLPEHARIRALGLRVAKQLKAEIDSVRAVAHELTARGRVDGEAVLTLVHRPSPLSADRGEGAEPQPWIPRQSGAGSNRRLPRPLGADGLM